jgi:hypothetical protein
MSGGPAARVLPRSPAAAIGQGLVYSAQLIADSERFRKSTETDACANCRFQTVRVASVVAGPSGAPRGFEYSGNQEDGMPHSTPALHGI